MHVSPQKTRMVTTLRTQYCIKISLIYLGKTLESLDPSLFTKNKPGKGGSNVKEREKQKEIAALEAQVYRFSGRSFHLIAPCHDVKTQA